MYQTGYHAGHATDPIRLAFKKRQAAERAAWLRPRFDAPRSAFEIGCGEGSLLAELAKDRIDVSGVEPGRDYAEFGRDHFGIAIETGFFPEVARRAELVIAVHVIEHIADPIGFLRQIGEVMARSCFVETPNLWQPKPGRISANLLAAPHLILFTPSSIVRAFAAADMKVDHLEVGVNLRVLASAGADGQPPRAKPLAAYKLWRYRLAG